MDFQVSPLEIVMAPTHVMLRETIVTALLAPVVRAGVCVPPFRVAVPTPESTSIAIPESVHGNAPETGAISPPTNRIVPSFVIAPAASAVPTLNFAPPLNANIPVAFVVTFTICAAAATVTVWVAAITASSVVAGGGGATPPRAPGPAPAPAAW